MAGTFKSPPGNHQRKVGEVLVVRAITRILVCVVVVGLAQSLWPFQTHAQDTTGNEKKETDAEFLLRQQERRKHEETKRREYLQETDQLIRSIRSQILEVELTIAEVRFLLEDFECASSVELEKKIEIKLEDLRSWRNEIASRCEEVSKENAQGQEICASHMQTTTDQISYYENVKGRSLQACKPKAEPEPLAPLQPPAEEGRS